MAKLKEKDVAPVYDAAKLFVERVLRSRDSLFTPGRPIWSEAPIQDVYRRFIEGWDGSADSFEAKLEKQLAGAEPDTVQFFGELLYVHFLPANSTGAPRKRKVIKGVLNQSRSPVAIPTALDRALEKGLAAEGMGYKLNRPSLLRYLIEFVRKWWRLDEPERSRALTDPWTFKDIATSLGMPRTQSQVEILLHLVHPDTFEPMMSRHHKQQIADAFSALVEEPTDDVDRKLLQIRRKLQEREGRDVSFYEPGILATWQPSGSPWDQFVRFAGLFYRLPRFDEWERDYKLALAERLKPAIAGLGELSDESVDMFHKVLRTREQNIVRWQDFEPFVDWYRKNRPASHLAVASTSDAARPAAERIRLFLNPVPTDVVKSSASRTTLASMFLLASDPRNQIVFRASPFNWAYKRVDYPQPPEAADEAARYEQAVGFCDRFI
ncbi:MAG: hypothetical protein AB7O37_18185 [Vicinamibacteria bacterium]